MYLDTSILVKLFVNEADSPFFVEATSSSAASSSELAYVELWSALLGKERANVIDESARNAAWTSFLGKVSDDELLLHPLDSTTLKKATHILERCHPHVPLRTLDALHIAACDLSQDFPLCTTDARMRAAAERFGIPVFPEHSAN
jgi:predicted nucleic acid-binding protein